jgi:hypothetical protein
MAADVEALLHWVIPGQRRSVAWMLGSDGQCEVWTAPGISEALIPGRMQSHVSTAKYPGELRERAVKMVPGWEGPW